MNAYPNENDNALFRQSLLTSPCERRDVEYKASVSFAPESEFGLKLVKHILGMANIGGGWIVIGHEDGSLRPDPKHTNEVTDTYDPTKLTAAVKSVVVPGQPVRLVVHRERNPFTGLDYPIIRVEGFARIPFICRSTKPNKPNKKPNQKPILQEHKVYIRRPGAETTEIQTPEDWDDLLKRCVSQRRSEFLAEFADMARRMLAGDATPPQDAKAALENWMDECKAASSTLQSLPAGYGYMEFAQAPTRTSLGRWSLDDLRRAAAESIAGPYGRDGWLNHLKPMKDGIELQAPDTSDLIALRIRTDGAFYVCKPLSEDSSQPLVISDPPPPGRPMWIDLAAHRIAWRIRGGIALYEALGIAPSEPYSLCIRHSGISGRVASTYDSMKYSIIGHHESRVDSHKWQQEITLDIVKANELNLVANIAMSLFELFDFLKVDYDVVARDVIQQIDARSL